MSTPQDDWLTTTQAAGLATQWRHRITGGRTARVSAAAICNWARRGHLEPAGLDTKQRPLYRRADVARAEQATRDRALRLLGIPQPAKEASPCATP